jgi:hypothetical protein
MRTPTRLSRPVGFGNTASLTPRVELDALVALSAMHTTGARPVPDPRGRTVLDIAPAGLPAEPTRAAPPGPACCGSPAARGPGHGLSCAWASSLLVAAPIATS